MTRDQHVEHLRRIQTHVRLMWQLMCEDLGISPRELFVAEDLLTQSKYYAEYSSATNDYLAARLVLFLADSNS